MLKAASASAIPRVDDMVNSADFASRLLGRLRVNILARCNPDDNVNWEGCGKLVTWQLYRVRQKDRCAKIQAPGRGRTANLLIRSQTP